ALIFCWRSAFLLGMSWKRVSMVSFSTGENAICVWAAAGRAAARVSVTTAASLLSFDGNLFIDLLQMDPRNRGIVGEDREPLLRNGPRVIALATLDGLQGKQVVSHHPCDVEVPRRGDEIRDVTRRFAAAAQKNSHHVARVSGINFHGDARNDLAVA